jgi:hypothetical protein
MARTRAADDVVTFSLAPPYELPDYSSKAFSETAATWRSASRSAPEEAITPMPTVTAER